MMLYKAFLTFRSVKETLVCDYLSESHGVMNGGNSMLLCSLCLCLFILVPYACLYVDYAVQGCFNLKV